METFSEVIALITRPALASDLGKDYGTVRKWDERNSIPPEEWEDVIESARRRKVKGINLKLFAKIAKNKKTQ
jgi:hypothetical protein